MMGMYPETATCELQLLKLVAPGKGRKGNKKSQSKALKVCHVEEGLGLFYIMPEGWTKTSEVRCQFSIKGNSDLNKMGYK